MACWLMTLNSTWTSADLSSIKLMPHKPLIKSTYPSGGNFTRGNQTISHKIWLENYSSEILNPRDQLDNYTAILFQYGRFSECMIITYWRLWALWKVICIYVYFLGYCCILPVLMDFHTSINPLFSLPIKMIYCIILIFVIFSHNKLSVVFSSALKRNWKGIGIGIGIDKKELELELLFFILKELELELELNVKEFELQWPGNKHYQTFPWSSLDPFTNVSAYRHHLLSNS